MYIKCTPLLILNIICFLCLGCTTLSPTRDVSQPFKNVCEEHADAIVFSSAEKEFVIFGVSHEQGVGPVQQCLKRAVDAFKPDTLVLHTVGSEARMKKRLASLPTTMWEEHDFLFQYAIDRQLKVSLTDPEDLDVARAERWRTTQISEVVLSNLAFELMKNIWEERRKVGLECDKNCLLTSVIQRFLQQQPWFEKHDLWRKIAFDLGFQPGKPDRWMESIRSKLNSYAGARGYKTFVRFLDTHHLFESPQPLILAPYPIAKDDFNKLAAIEHSAVNRSELERFFVSLRRGKRVLAQTGKAHLRAYQADLASKLKSEFGMELVLGGSPRPAGKRQ